MANVALINQQSRMTRNQAAMYLGVTSGTLAVWACQKRYSLPYYRIGRIVYYSRDDLDAFLEKSRVGEPLAIGG